MPEENNFGPIFLETTVKQEWMDFKGHMNMTYYVLLFEQGLSNFLDNVGLGLNYVRSTEQNLFALEDHITYQHELRQGDTICVHFQLLDIDDKFIHYFMRLIPKGSATVSATMEQISVLVNMKTRIPSRFDVEIMDALQSTLDKHKKIGKPFEMGQSIGIRRHRDENNSKIGQPGAGN